MEMKLFYPKFLINTMGNGQQDYTLITPPVHRPWQARTELSFRIVNIHDKISNKTRIK